MSYRCDCYRPEPFTDFDLDVVCLRCRRVLRVGPLGINTIGPAVGRGDIAPHGMAQFGRNLRKSRFAVSER